MLRLAVLLVLASGSAAAAAPAPTAPAPEPEGAPDGSDASFDEVDPVAPTPPSPTPAGSPRIAVGFGFLYGAYGKFLDEQLFLDATTRIASPLRVHLHAGAFEHDTDETHDAGSTIDVRAGGELFHCVGHDAFCGVVGADVGYLRIADRAASQNIGYTARLVALELVGRIGIEAGQGAFRILAFAELHDALGTEHNDAPMTLSTTKQFGNGRSISASAAVVYRFGR